MSRQQTGIQRTVETLELELDLTLDHLISQFQTSACRREFAATIVATIRLIESLPLTTDLYTFARNWLVSADALATRGEYNTAIFQVRMLRRKLAGPTSEAGR